MFHRFNHLFVALGLAALTFATGCGDKKATPPTTEPDVQLTEGQDEFFNYEIDYSARATAFGGAEPQSAPAAEAAEDSNKAPSGREGAVEEADIYRVSDNRLYCLNTYRGFIIYDLSNPAAPKLVSRLPVHGYPVEMFVSGSTVYALLRDALYVTQEKTGLTFKRHKVSQLVAIDIRDASNPKVLTTVDIVGNLKEGVSRKIDNTIYVVSHLPQSYYWAGYPYGGERTEQAWVYSFNVANPLSPQLVQKLKVFEGGGVNALGPSGGVNRWFSGVAISATSNTLHVVENWHTSEYVSGGPRTCGRSMSMQQAVVSIVDISDPSGVIRLHSRFETYGQLSDQFKQTYVYNADTQKAYYLGIFGRREWASVGCSGRSFTQNTLEAWDVSDGANPVRVSSLAFGKPDETVRGSAFDVSRSVVFAITARQIDPLYAISFADPSKLKILSEIDGLSGDMSVFRLTGAGKFLIGVGRDTSETCTGYQDVNGGRSTNIAVSLIDVEDLSKIRLVQRKCVTVKNAHWVSSDLTWNLDQAHKLIGLHSDDLANVISVPVHYYTRDGLNDGWRWSRDESAVGLMSFDFEAYDRAKDHLNQTVLKNHGTIVHSNGHVRRTIVFTHQGASPRRMMVNLSDSDMSVIDIQDLDAPKTEAEVEIAPNQSRVFAFGDHVVAEVRRGNDWELQRGLSEFRVHHFANGIEGTTPVATFSVPRVAQTIQWRNLLILIQSGEAQSKPLPSQAIVYDLANPSIPTLRGTVELPIRATPWMGFYCGSGWGYWPEITSGEWVETSAGLATKNFAYESGGYNQKLVFLDLRQPGKPVVTSRVLETYLSSMQPRREHLGLVSDGDSVFLNYKERVGTHSVGDTRFARYQYYVERLSPDTMTSEGRLNLPGPLARSWTTNGERYYLTTDRIYVRRSREGHERWETDSRLNLLRKTFSGKAGLRSTLHLEERTLGQMVGDPSRLFMLSRRHFASYGRAPTLESPSDELTTFDLTSGRLDQKFQGPLGTHGTSLMGLTGGRLFTSIYSDGVLALDVADLSAPKGQQFMRTLGYATHGVFKGDLGIIANGRFGIFEMNLAAPSKLASN